MFVCLVARDIKVLRFEVVLRTAPQRRAHHTANNTIIQDQGHSTGRGLGSRAERLYNNQPQLGSVDYFINSRAQVLFFSIVHAPRPNDAQSRLSRPHQEKGLWCARGGCCVCTRNGERAEGNPFLFSLLVMLAGANTAFGHKRLLCVQLYFRARQPKKNQLSSRVHIYV